jgi:hypothetical protein
MKNLLLISIILMACKTPKGTGVMTRQEAIRQGYIHVTVKDYRDLDGCQFLLVLENGEKLQPQQMDEKYKVDSIMLYIKYKKIDGMSICMAGTLVELTDVKPVQ